MNADTAMRLRPCLHVSVESPSLVTQLHQQDVVAHVQEPDYSIATSNTHTEVNMSNNLMLAQLMKDMQVSRLLNFLFAQFFSLYFVDNTHITSTRLFPPRLLS